MGRDIKRVPLDFDWPLNQVWEGYIYSETERERFSQIPCTCPEQLGLSPEAYHLRQQWYGYAPFRPEDNGSTRLRFDTPEVWAFAERNVTRSPEYYGTGYAAIAREGIRLANLWNDCWGHHLNQDDVDALVAAGRLYDFTHNWVKGDGWVEKDPQPVVTPEMVNAWDIASMGHDSINAYVVIEARAKREGFDYKCTKCDGHGSIEAYEGQRAAAERWEPTEPPEGEGWQVWETVSEGSPISPVFATREGLVQWLMSPEYSWGTSRPLTREQAENFVGDGWALSVVVSGGEVVASEGFRG